MTRAEQVSHAVSALREARASSSLPKPASMSFVVYEDNGGGYHWRIVAAGGETLVQSASFGSHEEAKQAARIVHGSASSASFEHLTRATPPVDLPAHRDAVTADDHSDAERWLDEGGSFTSEPATP